MFSLKENKYTSASKALFNLTPTTIIKYSLNYSSNSPNKCSPYHSTKQEVQLINSQKETSTPKIKIISILTHSHNPTTGTIFISIKPKVRKQSLPMQL